ncbi:WhiB family transcriptional regulator [Corynebacterium hansenii]|uniref:WhiB family transcriptional regulator n=1 Tax=Corynebacterium hansenii TaxID=394964 RepID=A0ABV7ZQ68_9CORY|nr:WhiB family transcriptional regulator [Corynebacterium hansenii]WJZ00496.1 Transcriptional regulator WhiB [Corynebacterium hansenii]
MTKTTRFPDVPDLPDLAGIRDQRLAGAACTGLQPLFDESVHGETDDARQFRHHRARAICARCPVRANCATVATEIPADHRHGIWAGTLLHPTTNHDSKESA